eukprot:scaffold33123_cov61-Cyclotella_meneghiniana.AAC.1
MAMVDPPGRPRRLAVIKKARQDRSCDSDFASKKENFKNAILAQDYCLEFLKVSHLLRTSLNVFSKQKRESSNHNGSTLTVPKSHCMYIKREAWLRLEYIGRNGLHGLAFQSWMGRTSANDLYVSIPRLGVLESPNHNCSTLTVPMSHCMYIKW